MVPAAAHAAPAPGGASAKPTNGSETRADFDSRTSITASPGVSLKARVAAAPSTSAVRKLRNSLGGQGIVDIDKATGTPRRVARLDGYLTRASSRKPAAIARAYVKAHSDVFGLNAAAVDDLTLRQDYVDIAGTHHLSFIQSVGGVPVFGNGLRAHVSKTGRLIQVDGSPLADLASAAGTARLSAAGARAAAVKDVSGTSAAKVIRAGSGATRTTTFSDGGNARLVYFLTAAGPRLAWQTVAVDTGFLHVVDAASGDILFRQSTVDADSALAWTNYPGAPRGGTQRRVSLSRWLPNNSPRLAGNVAHVYSDVDDDNAAEASEEVPPSGRRSFEYPFTDFTAQAAETGCTAQFKCSWDPKVPLSWQTNREQNAVQMYYFLGTWHDHLNRAPIGFTRSAGNFEAVDGDAVQGQSDDGANTGTGELAGLPDSNHIDNANMNTPPDGTPPVMQMYLFHDPSDPTDPFIAGNSGDESDIVYHEYTHGLSNRLVVDANGVSTLGNIQAGAMGEAWSDWYAMDYLVAQGLERDTSAPGELLVGKYVSAGQYLIRTEPTDCAVGVDSTACPGTPGAGPGGYTYGDFGRIIGAPEVHADGEIWAQTLWDLRKAIGSKKAESLVTRAMELSPANPSFLDERNSILQADLVVNHGRLQNKIWKVFAARGMGFFAAAADGDDTRPVEDFSLPPAASTPRGSLTGTVTDALTGVPLAGMTVGFGGHASGFAGDYAATTAADGTYTITGIIPGTYAKVFARGPGYEPVVRTLSIGSHASRQDWQLRRDWAALSGGSSVVDFNGADHTADGCGPAKLFDLSQGTGWESDAVFRGDGTIEPRFVIVQLPTAVDIAELDINPSTTCADGGSASTGDYRVETSPDGTTWTVASEGHFSIADRVMHAVPLTGGTDSVRFVRYTMLSNQLADVGGTCPGAFSGCDFVDSTELAVFGPAAGS